MVSEEKERLCFPETCVSVLEKKAMDERANGAGNEGSRDWKLH